MYNGSGILIKPKNSADGKGFVGMKFETDKNGEPFVEAIFPLGYHYPGVDNTNILTTDEPDETQAALKKELSALLGAIRRHSKTNDGKLEGMTANQDGFPYDAIITIIRDFMQYGYYIESEIKYQNAPIGKINWKRTIAQIKPTIQNKRYPVYTDFVIRQNAKKTDNMISQIHEWCVHEAFTKLGWLFTSFNPHKPALEIGEDKKERSCFVSIIREYLKSTFNDRNKVLFNAMIAMLEHYRADKERKFIYGTTHFQTVWENLIEASYGGILESEKAKYFPLAEWKFDIKGKPAKNSLQPDTIMLDGDNVFVLDAKYYPFIEDTENVPLAADINKQVAYGEHAAFVESSRRVYNAFLIPYDFKRDPHELGTSDKEKYFYIGYASMVSNQEKTYEWVLGILIDTKRLMQDAGRVDKNELGKFIREKYKKAKDAASL
jgi:hypothetical protein